ncbi:PH domain-containing protein [Thalassiella azotivora]
MTADHAGHPQPHPDPYRPFRPVRARRVALFVAVFSVVVLSVVGITLPGTYAWYDRAGFVATGLLIAWFCYRQASVRAVPSERGLVVRNLFLGRELEWAQVVSVRFGPDRTWAELDLADGDTLSVMAIQRADGERADAEARRLATLVAHGSRTERDD